MSERSEFFSLPDLCLTTPGTPAGGYDLAVAFFAYFLWRAKESE